jgi:hypothetical protein
MSIIRPGFLKTAAKRLEAFLAQLVALPALWLPLGTERHEGCSLPWAQLPHGARVKSDVQVDVDRHEACSEGVPPVWQSFCELVCIADVSQAANMPKPSMLSFAICVFCP